MSPARRAPLPPAALAVMMLCMLLGACVTARRRAPAPAPSAPPTAPVPPPPADVGAVPDAVPRLEPRSAHGNPPFYDVAGRRYFVLATADGYLERGVASWYGPSFHGGNTSSGEQYDMYGMSAAHKTLPLPSFARVTNLANGRSIVVRINDRGPFVANRLIDLSYTAALKLDMVRDGTAFVEVRTLTPGIPDSLTRSEQAPPPALYLQAGAFAVETNATRLIERLHAAGLTSAFVLAPLEGKRLYRVRIGPIGSVEEFDRIDAQLVALGIGDARLAPD